MKLSLRWLKDYLKVVMTPEQISEALTSLGLEVEKVESWESVKGGLRGVVAGKVLTCVKHPNADKLSLTTVDVGAEVPKSIVCGANNITAGQTVWVALPGTELYDASGKPWTISVSKIRGEVSEGMICAEDELGLGTSHDGIMVLPDDVAAGTKASDYYDIISDVIYEIGLTPNRSDATSILGIAADLAAFMSVQTEVFHPVIWPKVPELNIPAARRPIKVSVRRPEACPRYSGILLDNITVGETPEWIKTRLRSIGVKTINNVVDITNFILHEIGQPLHAFDADKITGDEIIVETKPAGTPFLALDGEIYNLNADDLAICDGDGNPMCIAGVYGGQNSGVSEGTTRLFLESAHFNAGWIRRTSMHHQLRTDAARRYEKGSDPNITIKALHRAVDLLQQYAGASVASEVIDLYPVPIAAPVIRLSLQTLREKSGVDFVKDQVEKIIEALHMTYEPVDDEAWNITVTTDKPDVLREIDLVEEILRVYGYDHVPVPGKMHTTLAVESRRVPHRMRRRIGDFLAARGYLEAMNMSLTQPGFYARVNWVNRESWVTIHNTSNESQNLLRPEMIVPMLETIRRNINRKQSDLRLFEFGKSYRQVNEIPDENEHLLLTLSGHVHPDHWKTGAARSVDFFTLKSDIHALLQRLGIHNWRQETLVNEGPWAYATACQKSGLTFVRFGRVSPDLCAAFDIRQEVFMADFDVETLFALSGRSAVIYEDLNRFPGVVRDLAIVIDDSIPYDRIHDIAVEAGGEWLSDIEVFDIYKNPEHVGEGKMSMALRFTIENREATLSDKEIDQWFSRMQKALAGNLAAEIRSA